jgi:hypothetical protein
MGRAPPSRASRRVGQERWRGSVRTVPDPEADRRIVPGTTLNLISTAGVSCCAIVHSVAIVACALTGLRFIARYEAVTAPL